MAGYVLTNFDVMSLPAGVMSSGHCSDISCDVGASEYKGRFEDSLSPCTKGKVPSNLLYTIKSNGS